MSVYNMFISDLKKPYIPSIGDTCSIKPIGEGQGKFKVFVWSEIDYFNGTIETDYTILMNGSEVMNHYFNEIKYRKEKFILYLREIIRYKDLKDLENTRMVLTEKCLDKFILMINY